MFLIFLCSFWGEWDLRGFLFACQRVFLDCVDVIFGASSKNCEALRVRSLRFVVVV